VSICGTACSIPLLTLLAIDPVYDSLNHKKILISSQRMKRTAFRRRDGVENVWIDLAKRSQRRLVQGFAAFFKFEQASSKRSDAVRTKQNCTYCADKVRTSLTLRTGCKCSDPDFSPTHAVCAQIIVSSCQHVQTRRRNPQGRDSLHSP
jgi:hypothetical protein